MITVTKNQGTIELLLDDTSIDVWMDAFIMDRKAQHFSKGTIYFYEKKFLLFNKFRSKWDVQSIKEITPRFIREYLLHLEAEGHNPGGVHAAYRAIKAFLNWWEDEFEPEEWKNPFKKVKAPKNPQKPLEPADIQTIQAILSSCKSNSFYDKRDKAIILTLMDTGIRANELINIDLKDLDVISGEILIRSGKGGKFRNVFLGKKSRKALRAYLRKRQTLSPALWVSKTGERAIYSTLRGILRRRSEKVGVEVPTLHSFRRFFALQMLRNGVDIFSLQKLMGHSDLQILRTYLKQTKEDVRIAHLLGGPVDQVLG